MILSKYCDKNWKIIGKRKMDDLLLTFVCTIITLGQIDLQDEYERSHANHINFCSVQFHYSISGGHDCGS